MSVLASAVELGAAGGVDVQKLLGSGPEAGAGAASAGEIVIEEIGSEVEARAQDAGSDE